MTLLTTAQAAEQTGVSLRTIQAAVQSGAIASVQVGPMRLIKPAALARWKRNPRGRPPKAK